VKCFQSLQQLVKPEAINNIINQLGFNRFGDFSTSLGLGAHSFQLRFLQLMFDQGENG